MRAGAQKLPPVPVLTDDERLIAVSHYGFMRLAKEALPEADAFLQSCMGIARLVIIEG